MLFIDIWGCSGIDCNERHSITRRPIGLEVLKPIRNNN
jgi:hypothetical protein